MLAAKPTLPPPPAAVDYTKGMPTDLGMMLNDSLGDCTCAAYYHARQVWTFNTGKMVTEPDGDVEDLYVKACGYDPRKGGEGPGWRRAGRAHISVEEGRGHGHGDLAPQDRRFRGGRPARPGRREARHQQLRRGVHRIQRAREHPAGECATALHVDREAALAHHRRPRRGAGGLRRERAPASSPGASTTR